MAALNQAKIIKGLEEITAQGADRFFFKFLKLYGFSKLTIQRLEQNDRVRNIGLREADLFQRVHTGGGVWTRGWKNSSRILCFFRTGFGSL